MARKLIVEIVGDSRSYERALGRSSAATNKFNADITKTAATGQALRGALSVTGGSTGFLFGSAAFVGAAAATTLISSTTAAASDLNEQISRTEVILGDSADAMVAWSQTTATSMGISQRAALAAGATFAGLFQTVGVDTAQAGELSRSLVQLAADLASLQNSSPEEALIALRSGLAGEAEPLRRFNIFLTEARVQQQALAATGKTTTAALTQQEKTLARYNLILKDAAPAMGNFALTSGELANQQRTLRANVDDLSARIGGALIPTLTAAATAANALFVGLDKLSDVKVDLGFGDTTAGGIFGWVSGWKELNFLVGEVAKGLHDVNTEVDRSTGPAGGPHLVPGPRTQAIADAKAAQEAIDKATRRANAPLDQQIRDSAARINHLKDLIREDPQNAKLQKRLTDEIKKQNTLLAQQKSLNESNAATAKAAGQAAHDAAVQAATDARQAEKDAAEARREQVKRSQFKALGLTPEGLKQTPGAGSLLQRATRLEDQIKGTALDTRKNRSQLKTIVNFLKKNFNKAGKDVREAILQMLNDISGAFKEGAKEDVSGPLTKTSGLNTRKLAEGLGLTPEQERELRQRASKFNSAGRALSGNRTNAPGGSAPGLDRGGPFVVESRITVNLDGQKIANVVTRNQQKAKRRNPAQKRGQNRK